MARRLVPALALLALAGAAHADDFFGTYGNIHANIIRGYSAPFGDIDLNCDYVDSSHRGDDVLSRWTWSYWHFTGNNQRYLLGDLDTAKETFVTNTHTGTFTHAGFPTDGIFNAVITDKIFDGDAPHTGWLVSSITVTNPDTAAHYYRFFHECDGTVPDPSVNPGTNDSVSVDPSDPTHFRFTDSGGQYLDLKYAVPANVQTAYKLGKHSEISGNSNTTLSNSTATVTASDVASCISLSFTLQPGESVTIGFGLGVNAPARVTACNADFNGDGFLDIFDFSDFVTCFEGGSCPPGTTADYNGDGFPDFFDFNDFVTDFENGC